MGMGCRSQLPSGHGISGNLTPCPLVGSPVFFSGNSSTASLEFLQGTLEAPLPPLQGVHTPASRQACLWAQLWGQAFRALGREPLRVPSSGSGPSRTLIFIPKADVPVAFPFLPCPGSPKHEQAWDLTHRMSAQSQDHGTSLSSERTLQAEWMGCVSDLRTNPSCLSPKEVGTIRPFG